MIAKGLDFPNVTLVGVINADTALHLPDFRAAERTFQLVTQVAGRTGRGEKGGRVLVQTFSPDHPAILAAVRHDLRGVRRRRVADPRRRYDYPPFASMIRLVVRGPAEPIAGRVCRPDRRRGCAPRWTEPASTSRVLGPAPAPIAKLRGNFRFQIQGAGRRRRSPAPGRARRPPPTLKPPDDVQWIVDVDPLDML